MRHFLLRRPWLNFTRSVLAAVTTLCAVDAKSDLVLEERQNMKALNSQEQTSQPMENSAALKLGITGALATSMAIIEAKKDRKGRKEKDSGYQFGRSNSFDIQRNVRFNHLRSSGWQIACLLNMQEEGLKKLIENLGEILLSPGSARVNRLRIDYLPPLLIVKAKGEIDELASKNGDENLEKFYDIIAELIGEKIHASFEMIEKEELTGEEKLDDEEKLDLAEAFAESVKQELGFSSRALLEAVEKFRKIRIP